MESPKIRVETVWKNYQPPGHPGRAKIKKMEAKKQIEKILCSVTTPEEKRVAVELAQEVIPKSLMADLEELKTKGLSAPSLSINKLLAWACIK